MTKFRISLAVSCSKNGVAKDSKISFLVTSVHIDLLKKYFIRSYIYTEWGFSI